MRTRIKNLLLLFSILTSTVAQANTHLYQITVSKDLNTLTVKLCFDGKPPRTLYNTSSKGARYLNYARHKNRNLRKGSYNLSLGRLANNACIDYQVKIGDASRENSINSAARVGKDLLTSANLWLWRPSRNAATSLEAKFILPTGISVSTPWKPIGKNHFELGQTPHSWPCQVAFGRFTVNNLALNGANLRLSILDGEPKTDLGLTKNWLLLAAEELANLYGSFPDPYPQILVVPLGRGNEPMPYAQVTRGGGSGVHFYIDQRRSAKAFNKDWTASHELSHLLLPFVDRDDAWLSEGLASYFQNVLMSRNGTLTQRRSWEKLYQGFQRGINRNYQGTLKQASERMYSDGTNMRVYWSGAAIAMLADIQLRQRSNGKQSLISALEGLKDCCLPSDRLWSAWEVMSALDDITNTSIFTDLYNQYVYSRQFPEYQTTFEKLGIQVQNNRIKLKSSAELLSIRNSIMGAPSR